ncbi:CHAT domain-containing protein [cf. Phormidesmis sp. LEGE 11477]|uniref:CHAT domain-containing protein n=1 Tax=cf. Phormidesmis sp. LEGE 11477 TaxID=1828680 RepID=UPI00187E3BC1|nr:CHAT domain-containing protein [cf. Phormidesmis sp. LEGE 11477]MBE9062846.1 tetratricopeptide repeat protein [cf. Phormidesmis sp. LEGE 11477]
MKPRQRFLLAVCLVSLSGFPLTRAVTAQPKQTTTSSQSIEAADELVEQISSLYQAGDYAEALPLAIEALAIRESALGLEHPDTINSLKDVGELHFQLSDYDSAQSFYEKALSYSEAALGQNHYTTAVVLNGLAKVYVEQGDYNRAIPVFERTVAIVEDVNGVEHINVAYALTSLGKAYVDTGAYERALPVLERSLSIRESTFGTESEEYASGLHSIARLYAATGNFTAAIPVYEQAIAAYQADPNSEDTRLAASLVGLGTTYQELNNYSKATPLVEQALEILERAYGKEHIRIANTLISLGSIYSAQGEYTKALRLYERALSIRASTLGRDHYLVGASLNNLALLYAAKGDHIPAISLYKQALVVLEAVFDEPNTIVASTLHNLALAYTRQNNFDAALPLYERSIEITRSLYGTNHPDTARALNSLGDLHHKNSNIAQAVDLFWQANAIEEYNLSTVLASASEARRQEYIKGISASINANISVHLVDSLPDADTKKKAATLAATTILQRKGRILEAVANTSQALRADLSAEEKVLFDELNTVRSELATLKFDSDSRQTDTDYSDRVRALEVRAEELDEALARRSAEFSAGSEEITIESISRNISRDAALVEFVRYHAYSPVVRESGYRYAAYVLTNQGNIQAVDLGDAEPIEQLVSEFRQTLSNRSERAGAIAQQLNERLIAPIRPFLSGKSHLLLSPDSQLNLIPFDALVDERDRYLIESYQISYLNSGRDLLKLQTDAPSRQAPVVIANPSYEGSASRAGNGQRSVDANSLYFSALPGTASEGSAIASLLPAATLLTEQQATESALKQVSAPNILHIATHGFFLPDVAFVVPDANSRAASFDLVDVETPAQVTSSNLENPLLRSGLAFAGANSRSSDGEDGIFTALEASGLDLYGTKLVVLSACETGVGAASSGEGVYGLRRAFAIAGAESQLMSLWQVDDTGTSELMQLYYQNLIEKKQGRSEALRNAQLELLNTGTYQHPYYWSSFIFSGDWRPLE